MRARNKTSRRFHNHQSMILKSENVCYCELYLEADDELDDVEACFEGVAEEADEHDGEQHGRGRHVPLLK